jgi:hypothetical protein
MDEAMPFTIAGHSTPPALFLTRFLVRIVGNTQFKEGVDP